MEPEITTILEALHATFPISLLYKAVETPPQLLLGPLNCRTTLDLREHCEAALRGLWGQNLK